MRFERLKDFVATMVVVLVTAAALGFGGSFLQPALSQPTSIWPQLTVANVLSSASSQIIGTNPTRRYLSICNPSTIVVWIAPGTQAAAANGGGSVSISPVASNVTSCFTTPILNDRNPSNSWNAIAVTTPTSLTILEY